MKLGSVLAQGGVVLLDKVPADFILGVGGSGRRLGGSVGCGGRSVGGSVGRSSAILLLVDSVSVCCHRIECGASLRSVESFGSTDSRLVYSMLQCDVDVKSVGGEGGYRVVRRWVGGVATVVVFFTSFARFPVEKMEGRSRNTLDQGKKENCSG